MLSYVSAVAHPTLFKLKQHCAYGQQWRVCGNLPELGKWDPVAALPMVVRYLLRGSLTLWGPDDQWFALVDLPEGQHIEYKHVLYDEHTGKYFWVQDGECHDKALTTGVILPLSTRKRGRCACLSIQWKKHGSRALSCNANPASCMK
eukprot:1161632-Pelagomonas_calceolata.AAC.3